MLAATLTAPWRCISAALPDPKKAATSAPRSAELMDAVVGKVATVPSTAACMVTGSQAWPAVVSTVLQRGWVCTTAITSGRAR